VVAPITDILNASYFYFGRIYYKIWNKFPERMNCKVVLLLIMLGEIEKL